MSDAPQDLAENSADKRQKRKKNLAIFFFLLILSAVVATVYWAVFVRGYAETEDAYVSGGSY